MPLETELKLRCCAVHGSASAHANTKLHAQIHRLLVSLCAMRLKGDLLAGMSPLYRFEPWEGTGKMPQVLCFQAMKNCA
jgi:hypothetical protein